jgi:nucleoside-diphosphate-sugar epimerase
MLYNKNKPVIAITGANGFIGSSLLKYFHECNFPVIALARRIPVEQQFTEVRFFDLEQLPNPRLLTGVDILIHCAFIRTDVNARAEQLNNEGTKLLIACARTNGVKKIIFFSSVSAHEKALSAYGKSKFFTETLFDMQKDVVLKCSLVIGDGGLFKRMLNHILSKKLVPLIDNGRQPLQIIAIDDVLKAVHTIISENISGNFILANKQLFTYRSFFQTIARIYNKQPFFIPVPMFFLQAIVYVAGKLKLPFPINKDNIQGLKAMRFLHPDDSMHHLQINPITLEEKLQALKYT